MSPVHFFQRSLGVGRFSIERLFNDIRAEWPESSYQVHHAPQSKVGILAILQNLWHAYRHRGPINHVVGDTNYQALALPSRSTILTIHDFVGLQRGRGLRQRLIRWLWYQWPIAHARVVTVISEQTRDELFRLFPQTPPEKVVVIPNGINAAFQPDETPPTFPDRPTVLHIGEKPNKNLERVIAALSGLPIRLRILGSPTEAQRSLLEQAELEYSISGRLTDDQIVSEYRNADMVCFPSLFEGFGLPILEAQASGRPLITSDRAPMNQVCGEDAACLVPPEDTAAIRAAVKRLINDPDLRAKLVANGIRNAAQYRSDVIAQRYRDVYRRVTD